MIVYVNNVCKYSEYHAVTTEVVSAVLQSLKSQVSEKFLRPTLMINSVSMPSWRVEAVVLATILLSLIITPVYACGWHYETIKAEGRSLPCTRNVALNAYPSYQESHLRQKIRVAVMMSALLPTSLRALDELTVSSILLKDLPRARCALERREALAPDDYATHANWGTYFTFSGELELAERHVKATLKDDPEAHFGRERDHLTLIQYLREHQAEGKFTVDMYGRSLKKHLSTLHPVKVESRQVLREQEAALVSMISIYGASENPLLFATLGITLKQQGNKLLAAAAFQKAIRFKHPQRSRMRRWIKRADKRYRDRFNRRSRRRTSRRSGSRGQFAELTQAIGKAETAANYRVKKYHKWLTKRFKRGMKFWDTEGLEEIYSEQVKRKLRCKLPNAQPVLYQMPRYPSHEHALKSAAPQLMSLLSALQSLTQSKARCAHLQQALSTGLATTTTADTKSDQSAAQAETSKDQTHREVQDLVASSDGRAHDSVRETLNRIIEIGLACPQLNVTPLSLPCWASPETPSQPASK